MFLQLTKQSTGQEIKAYFEEVLRMTRDSEEFPVNLDDVWPLVFGRKQEAVRALKNDKLFVESIDYQPLRKDAQRSDNGQFNGCDKVTYMLSVPCLEFFIARKVRPVFEVYRQVFHKVASGELIQVAPAYSEPCDFETTITPFTDYAGEVYKRWKRLFELSDDKARLRKDYQNWLITYRNFCYYTNQLAYLETMEKLNGACYLI